mgnify:CR=1 FL=1
MNLIEEIKKRLLVIEKVQQKEDILKNIKIVWETDPTKMQFEKLRSYNSLKDQFNSKILRVEDRDLTSHEYVDIFTGDVRSHMEMIDILLNGGKLIPPSTTEGYAIVDGVEKMVRPSTGGNDGTHRYNLAKYFGLKTIPVVVFKSFDGYWFTPGLWDFDASRDEIKATSKTGQVVIFKNRGYIDDSSTQYLIIRAEAI